VRILAGPLVNFRGVVDEIDSELRMARVKVDIFGRKTPIEVDLKDLERD
jgi:transcriptional antiterminator NusG